MATDLENLQTARSAVIAQISELDPRKMDYSIDGQSVSYSAYRSHLLALLKEYNQLIADESGPFQIDTRGVT